MVEHFWGDKDFDWEGLNKAGAELDRFCRRWGRIGLHWKEKYGCLRAYTNCAFVSEYNFLHSLVYPGHAYLRSKIISWLDQTLAIKGLAWLLCPILIKYQFWIYKKGYQKIIKKYPHLKQEITEDMDYPEVLKNT